MRKWLIILIIVFMIMDVYTEYTEHRDRYLYIYKYMYVKHNKVEEIVDNSVWQSGFYYYIYKVYKQC